MGQVVKGCVWGGAWGTLGGVLMMAITLERMWPAIIERRGAGQAPTCVASDLIRCLTHHKGLSTPAETLSPPQTLSPPVCSMMLALPHCSDHNKPRRQSYPVAR